MAKIIGINNADSLTDITVYDPTCGSGSLLLRVGSESNKNVTLYGQEKEATTAGLARMNMILHNNPTAEIKQGNTLANPLFEESGHLKIFDFVVANPPFSDKRWSNGLTLPEDNPYNRFSDFGVPPSKNGDYAFLLHIVRSLKRYGKGAIILPHGVLFRGNAEAEIRKNLIRKGYIKGIIGLPPNLFYGTGIPASIIVIDKENALNRKGIFIIDAGKNFIKDGSKNRLREQDIHKIADVFNNQKNIAYYSRMVSIEEIEKNEFNLNIPRYIENLDTEDIQDIEAHLLGGIPNHDIDLLSNYWEVYPSLRRTLFEKGNRNNYSNLKIGKDQIKQCIFEHPEFLAFTKQMDTLFESWKTISTVYLKNLTIDIHPKQVILEISENLLAKYTDKPLIDKYDIYQHLLNYWNEIMQDDCYIIAADGWKAETYRILVENKQKKLIDKGWTCDLIPKELVMNRFLLSEKHELKRLETDKENISAELIELEEEHSGDGGFFSELDKVNKVNIQARIRELKGETDVVEELEVLKKYLVLLEKYSAITKQIKDAETTLDTKLYKIYPTLTGEEIKSLVVNDKWINTIETTIKGEIDAISNSLARRIKELAERYESPLPNIEIEVSNFESKVSTHLMKMGFLWK
jgi:type I restriction enzyme M protein